MRKKESFTAIFFETAHPIVNIFPSLTERKSACALLKGWPSSQCPTNPPMRPLPRDSHGGSWRRGSACCNPTCPFPGKRGTARVRLLPAHFNTTRHNREAENYACQPYQNESCTGENACCRTTILPAAGTLFQSWHRWRQDGNFTDVALQRE